MDRSNMDDPEDRAFREREALIRSELRLADEGGGGRGRHSGGGGGGGSRGWDGTIDTHSVGGVAHRAEALAVDTRVDS